MKESVITRHMERTARNLLLLNLPILAVIIGSFLFSFRYFYNCARGPFPMDRGELLALENPGSQFCYFVKVVGDKGIHTGAGRTKNGVIERSFNFIIIHDRVLLVQSSDDDYYGETATGSLVPIPDDVQVKVLDIAVANNPNLKGRFLPFMLDATNFHRQGIIAFILGLPVCLVTVWNVGRAVLWLTNPRKHPLTRVLARFGDPARIAEDIQAEYEGSDMFFIGPLTFTNSWVLQTEMFSVTVGRLDDTLWVYKQVVEQVSNFTQYRTTSLIVMWSQSWRGPMEVRLDARSCDRLLTFFTRRVPWALSGFDSKLKREIRRHPDRVRERVEERRRQMAPSPE